MTTLLINVSLNILRRSFLGAELILGKRKCLYGARSKETGASVTTNGRRPTFTYTEFGRGSYPEQITQVLEQLC